MSVDEIDRHIKTEETMKQDLHAEVTARIVAQLETGVRPWMRPWTTGESVAGRPLRATGEPYRGINTLILWEASLIRGYHAPTWITFRQARAEGGTVRRGERGTTVVYSSALTRTDVDPETGEEAETRIPFLKSYTVFNVEQCDGLPDRLTAPLPACPEPERIAAAEAFIEATGARIEAGGGRAFYAPARDMIGMPARTAFRDAHGWYATLLHELTHWTGHPARCHRQFGRRFADQAYAREELVAELGAAFLCADLGVALTPREDHAAYLASWLDVLRADKRAIFQAASFAARAVDYLHTLQAAASGQAVA
ncbi:ArdC family protein [Tistrella mobilis]|uniref:ArdC family protein n=1 Tax=Tistrella mobilis TaxID=171437 RepID=UPI0035582A63